MLMDAYSAEHTHEYLIAEARKEGKEEGIKEGKEEGIKEGEAEGRKKVVRSMLAKKFPIATIAECTGLDEKTILSLM
jgi:predicted transposase/invertase (TIGR01784 family)